jgi:16S rRNA (cytosine1402-N4)-methyltransferase
MSSPIMDEQNGTQITTQHIPVLVDEVITGLNLRSGAQIIDGTLGGGGHTARMLEASAPDGHILGLDADPEAVERVSRLLSAEVASGRLHLIHANFDQIAVIAEQHGFHPVDAILLDLGVSSFQIDTPDRGFSFQQDGPLDMRLDPTQPLRAADVVNTWSETDLANLIYEYGEERHSRRIARSLVRQRPFATTSELATAVTRAVGGRQGQRLHPATRTFQALRIAVNSELERLSQVLPQTLALLRPGGRLAIISFHSLEDRIVKQWMQREARDYVPDPYHPHGGYSRTPTLRIITPKPVTPSDVEIDNNPRSRSAKLRIAQRVAEDVLSHPA